VVQSTVGLIQQLAAMYVVEDMLKDSDNLHDPQAPENKWVMEVMEDFEPDIGTGRKVFRMSDFNLWCTDFRASARNFSLMRKPTTFITRIWTGRPSCSRRCFRNSCSGSRSRSGS
jgi:hypothetical protein